MRDHLELVDPGSLVAGRGGASDPFGWRHVGTLLLLLITLPVFAAAGVIALAILPLVITAVGITQVRQLVRPQPLPAPVRR